MVAPLEVDVTGWTIDQLDAVMDATVDADTPADPASTGWAPFVRVVRAGGSDDNIAIDAATVVFHCFAATDKAANALAYAVRGALRDLVGTVAEGGILTHASKIGGPTWAANENSAVRHVVLTMQLRIKAV